MKVMKKITTITIICPHCKKEITIATLEKDDPINGWDLVLHKEEEA